MNLGVFRNNLALKILLWCLLSSCSISQVVTTTSQSEPIVLRNADSLVVSTIDSVSVRELSGHVHLDQGNVSVFCDHAFQYLAENRIVLSGSVKIVQGTVVMYMPRGEYNGNLGVAHGEGGVRIVDRKMVLLAPTGDYSMKLNQADFFGGVSVEDDSIRIDAQELRYLKSTQESWAKGQVLLRSKVTNSLVLGDSAHNVPATSYSVIRGRPLLQHVDTTSKKGLVNGRDTVVHDPHSVADSSRAVKNLKKKKTPTPSVKTKQKVGNPKQTKAHERATIDSLNAIRSRLDSMRQAEVARDIRLDTVTIRAEVMESFRAGGEDRYVASRNAEVVRGSIAARAGRCVYDKNMESIDLQIEPRLWADSLQLSADSIWVHLPQKKLSSIRAYHDSFLLLHDSTTKDRPHQLSGETMLIDIQSDTIRAVRSIRDAKSLYFMSGEQGPDGASRTLCDSLFVLFDAGQLDHIVWRSGVSSEYYPENLVGGGTRKYYLPSYRDVGRRPLKPDVKRRLEARNGALKSNDDSVDDANKPDTVPDDIDPVKPDGK